MLKLVSLLGICLILSACNEPQTEGEKFYEIFAVRNNWGGMEEELDKYPLEQQYEIFLFGMQKRHPPNTWLAWPIAKRGKEALDYVFERLESSEWDMDYVDSMEIFRALARGGYYPLCEDSIAMQNIESNATKIRHDDWRKFYKKSFTNLKDYCVRPDSESEKKTQANRGSAS